ncbi:cuticle protein 14 isoform b [Caerostris extrusa]|uniref:Cuticle protein 14 isoform b n=1 Tax=Caerostris extrusa TaxID=172846 RepID=A0AAV4UTQ8_CAEEX|nr:cuticle protein 14 isoform b [Caerostris extrusa]
MSVDVRTECWEFSETLGQYAFGYNEDHLSGGSFRRETGDEFGNKIGSYGLRVADGRIRVVNYVADHNGYRADVISNEPGLYSHHSNGYFGIDKKRIYGVAVPGLRFSAEAPYLTFSNGHQQEPVEVEQIEPAISWHDTVQDRPGKEPLYVQADDAPIAVAMEGHLSQGIVDYEASATEHMTTESNTVHGDSHQTSESGTIETVIDTSTNNHTVSGTTDRPAKDLE